MMHNTHLPLVLVATRMGVADTKFCVGWTFLLSCVGHDTHVEPKLVTNWHVSDTLPTCHRHSQLSCQVWLWPWYRFQHCRVWLWAGCLWPQFRKQQITLWFRYGNGAKAKSIRKPFYPGISAFLNIFLLGHQQNHKPRLKIQKTPSEFFF